MLEFSRQADRQGLGGFLARHLGVDIERYAPAAMQQLLLALQQPHTDGDSALRFAVTMCSIGETFFFRDREQLVALREILRSEGEAGQGAPLRVWSAGCATGEEAYTLSALLGELDPRLEVRGTDVNTQFLATARQATYRPWSMRGVDPAWLEGWMQLEELDARVIGPTRERVQFEQHNLAHDDITGEFDVIVCRNVLLYFRDDLASTVLGRFASVLRPGGLLVLGPVDPPPRGREWEPVGRGANQIFRRVSPHVVPAPRPTPPARVVRRPAPPPPLARSPTLGLMESLATARAFASAGRTEEAQHLLEDVSRQHPLEVEPWVLAAMVAEDRQDAQGALEAARRAHLLAPDEVITQYLLALCLGRVGQTARGQGLWQRALAALARCEPEEPLPLAQGLTAAQLRRMIDARSDFAD